MPKITLKDNASDKPVTLEYENVVKIQQISDTHAQVEMRGEAPVTYEFGLDGMRRLKNWMITLGTPDDDMKFDPFGVGKFLGVTRRANPAREALVDLITHGDNLLEAIDARIAQAKVEDGTPVDPVEPSHDPADANESYWKHEREVVVRMIGQAKEAIGHTGSGALK